MTSHHDDKQTRREALAEASGTPGVALSTLLESIRAERAAPRSRPLILASRLVQLGHLHAQQDNREEAEASFTEALSLLPRTFPQPGELTADLRFKVIASALEGLGELDDAISYQEMAVELVRAMCTPDEADDPAHLLGASEAFTAQTQRELAQGLYDLGRLYLSKQRLDDAASTLQESLGLQQALLPADHPQVIQCLAALASLEPRPGTSC